MPVKHNFVSAVSDVGIPAGWVKPSNWNEDHDLDGMLATLDAVAPAANKGIYLNGSGTAGLFALSDFVRDALGAETGPLFTAAIGAIGTDSPAFTGNPTAPTQLTSDNSTRLANTAFVKAALAALVGAAPATLDTLTELSDALGDDPNFATTMTNALALKAPLASPALTGNPIAPTQQNTDKSTKLATTAFAYSVVGALGQCVLKKVSSNLVLSPKNGNLLTVNGINCTVPDAGVSLAPTSLTPSTSYYIYAVATSGAISSLEASATVPVVDTTAGNKGVMIKTGDATRSLVGFARVISGPAWQDTPAQRFVRSWFNDEGISSDNAFSSSRTTASTTYAELNTEIRIEALLWSGEEWIVSGNGGVNNNTVNSNTFVAAAFDGTTAEAHGNILVIPNVAGLGGFTVPFAFVQRKSGLSEGYHYATIVGRVDVGTMALSGGAGFFTHLTGRVQK